MLLLGKQSSLILGGEVEQFSIIAFAASELNSLRCPQKLL